MLADRLDALRDKVLRDLGPEVAAALADVDTTDVMLNPDGSVWVDRLGQGTERVGRLEAMRAEAAIAAIATELQTSVSRHRPFLEGESALLFGVRVMAALPPAVRAPAFCFRKPASSVFPLSTYVEESRMTAAQAATITAAVVQRKNVLVSGGTSSGKTTLTNAILSEIARLCRTDRVVVLEKASELQCSSPNCFCMVTCGDEDLESLLRRALWARPDRIVVGEVRGPEAMSVLRAWNTGHPGGVCTVHADSAELAVRRFEQMAQSGGAQVSPEYIADAIDLIVQMDGRDGQRRVVDMQWLRFSEGHYEFSSALPT